MWQEEIITRLKEKRKREWEPFEQMFNEIAKLTRELNTLKLRNSELESLGPAKHADGAWKDVAGLQNKLLNAINEKDVVTAENKKLQERLASRDKQLAIKDKELIEAAAKVAASELRASDLQTGINRVNDEYGALKLHSNVTDEKLRQLEKEHDELVTRWVKMKAAEAEEMNDGIAKATAELQRKMNRELVEASKDDDTVRVVMPNTETTFATPITFATVPTSELHKFLCESECDAVRWSVSGRLLATAGIARQVNIWQVNRSRAEKIYTLSGCNQGILSVDIDNTEENVVAASTDFSCKLWTLSTQRMRESLNGHSAKVTCVRFADTDKCVSGSDDRTIRIWSLGQGVRTEVRLGVSKVQDLGVITPTTVVTGHFDKKLRLWDLRQEKPYDEVLLQSRVCGIDISSCRTKVLALTRDNLLTVVDLRQHSSGQVMASLAHDDFDTFCDHNRACFSPDSSYVAAGSRSGAVFVWNVTTSQFERQLVGHQQNVVACSWQPAGDGFLASVDKQKTCIIWY